eukprot:30909-Pelagococcus_subviridis.AAC.4
MRRRRARERFRQRQRFFCACVLRDGNEVFRSSSVTAVQFEPTSREGCRLQKSVFVFYNTPTMAKSSLAVSRTPHAPSLRRATRPNRARHPPTMKVIIRRPLRGVDELVREALRDRLHVPKRRLARARRDEVDGLVHAAQRGDVHGLATNDAGAADARRVFPRPGVDDRVDDDLNRVLVRQKVDDVHRVLDDPHRHELLAVVAAVHHERVHEPLHDRALRLAEALLRVAARGVRDVHRVLGLHADVILRSWRRIGVRRRRGGAGSGEGRGARTMREIVRLVPSPERGRDDGDL